MCGIAGLVTTTDSPKASTDKVLNMVNALIHRGPDQQSVWGNSDHSVFLGHARLAIQDLSEFGAQPMSSQSARYHIAFNGEIYNFLSLKKEFLEDKYSFQGHSDTEVLLALIETFGLSKTLPMLKGMFAFALYDEKEQKLHIVRDPIGEKPLYYSNTNGMFTFASELKALLKVNAYDVSDINFNALGSFFRYGYTSAPESILTSVEKLQPGHMLTLQWELGKPQIQMTQACYIDLKGLYEDSESSLIETADEALSRLDSTLNEVISEQSISDVSLGAFLSGGIDSTLVAALLQSQSQTPIDTFTIGFNQKEFDEAPYAKRISQHIGSTHNELYISPKDVLEAVPDIVGIFDEPFADSSQLPMLIVSRLAKSKVTVCLAGDGGDELFNGYNRYVYPGSVKEKTRFIPQPIKAGVSAAIKSVPPRGYDALYRSFSALTGKRTAANIGLKAHKFADVLSLSSMGDVYAYLTSYSDRPEQFIVSSIVEPDLMKSIDFQTDFMNKAMLWDQLYYLPGDNLVKCDRASMSCSLEMRLPLLDMRVVDLSWKIPQKFKYKDGKTKWLLRELLYQHVPRNLIERPKMGFSVPIDHWLRNELRDWAETLFSNEILEDAGLQVASVKKLYQEHLSGTRNHGNALWAIAMYLSWFKQFLRS